MKRIGILFFLTLLVFSASATRMSTKEGRISLWKGSSEKHFAWQTRLTPFIPSVINEDYKGTAIIICPGGSYSWLDRKTEGEGVANWLKSNGIPAFVLEYRTQGALSYITHYRLFVRGNRYPDAQRDLQKAIQYVKENADYYGLNFDNIGVMGFSAGGHLVMNSVCNRDYSNDLEEKWADPDFIVPVYPVVTMNGEHAHIRSRRALLGEYGLHDKELRNKLSPELNIPNNCPPVFLVCCKDDKVVDFQNSTLLDSALTAKGIPHKFILLESGGHGFGASDIKGTKESRRWKSDFLVWLKNKCK